MTDSDQPYAKFMRLQNGDDIIAEVVETEDEDGILYTLFHPLKVVYMPSESVGYLSVAFMPWVFPRICDQQEFVIHAEDVLMVADVAEKMNIYYWENVDLYTKRDKEREVEEPPVQEEEIEQENMNDILEALQNLANKRTYH